MSPINGALRLIALIPTEAHMAKHPALSADDLRLRQYDKLSPDIRALMMSANAKTSANRIERRAAARARAEAARVRKNREGQTRDNIILLALVILIASMWAVAGLMFYLSPIF